MAASLETRVPLLDHRVVEQAWRTPLSFKIRGGEGKWALRQILYKYVPRKLIERPKAGFRDPYRCLAPRSLARLGGDTVVTGCARGAADAQRNSNPSALDRAFGRHTRPHEFTLGRTDVPSLGLRMEAGRRAPGRRLRRA